MDSDGLGAGSVFGKDKRSCHSCGFALCVCVPAWCEREKERASSVRKLGICVGVREENMKTGGQDTQ